MNVLEEIEAIHQLKYRGWPAVAAVMADRMAGIPLPADVRGETRLVIPVPTTGARIRERGYNQAAVLAEAVAQRSRRTCLEALIRGGASSSQTTLQPAARLANVAGAFALGPGMARTIADEHVLLVDDVLTTGATVIACTDTLVDAGARCVSVLTFARATGRIRLE